MNKNVVILILLALLLTSCTPKVTEPIKIENPDVLPIGAVDNAKITDLKEIYSADDETSVVSMYLTVMRGNKADNTDHSWSDVNANPIFYYEDIGVDPYAVEGLLQVGDENGPTEGLLGYGKTTPNAVVTLRGRTSSRGRQKSYKINIKKDMGKWREQSVISLNKHIYDPSRFRNKLSYDLLKTIPDTFSARTQFVRLYVKDLSESGSASAGFVDYGLYTQVEQINTTYLRTHALDENGYLYKANMFEFLRYTDDIKLTADPGYDELKFAYRMESKGNPDHSRLIEMLDELNNYSVPIEETFEKYFDRDNYFTWLAFQMLTGNVDTTSQNFFLYCPGNSNKWHFISWDNDGGWGGRFVVSRNRASEYNFTLGVGNYWNSVLHQRVLRSSEYRNILSEKVEELKAKLSPEFITEYTTKYSEVVRPFVYSAPDLANAQVSAGDYNRILGLMNTEIDYNYEMYKQSLKKPMPFFIDQPIMVGEQIAFNWETAYDFDGSRIHYTFELSRDYRFQSVISKQDGLVIPQATVNKLPSGEYFCRVTATNAAGEIQTAMEIYTNAASEDFYGVRAFYVNGEGGIE